MLLATGTTAGENAAAFDLYLDFTSTTAGIIDVKWESRNNGNTGSNRQALFKVQTNTGPGGAFVDLPNSAVTIANYTPASGTIQVKLPAAFDGKADARVRFYLVTTPGGDTGNRPKFFIDRVVATATPIPTHLPKITTLQPSLTQYEVTEISGSKPFEVPYTYNGTFTGIWKAQLSDRNGRFSMDLDENIIGTSGAATGVVQARIPAGTPCGTGYRIRVLNTEPLRYGIPYGADLRVVYPYEVKVTPVNAQTISYPNGKGNTLTASSSLPGESSYAWKYATSADGPYDHTIPGLTSSSYTVDPTDFPGPGTYYLVATATSPCGAVGMSEPVIIELQGLVVFPSALSFGEVSVGQESAPQLFMLVGRGIQGDVTIVPPPGFELSVVGEEGFTSEPVTLSPENGIVSATIMVRFVPASAQVYDDAIALSSKTVFGGFSKTEVLVNGTGVVGKPVLTTAGVTDVTAASAVSGGIIQSSGGSPITAKGIVWSPVPGPSLEENAGSTTEGSGSESFSSRMDGLEQNTLYYVRAYATNSSGTAYGNEVQFTTLPAAPTEQAHDIHGTYVGAERITIAWTNGNGTGRVVKVNTENDFTDPADGEEVKVTGNVYRSQGEQAMYRGGDSKNSLTITGLEPGTAYWFRIYELNNAHDKVRYNTSIANDNPVLIRTITPLPVELVRFHASLDGINAVALEWETASELNNSHFHVERSTDGKHFKTIGRVKGAGTSAIPHQYTFSDTNIPRGTVYYRLAQIDFDGTSTYSSIKSVRNVGSDGVAFKAYPVPTQDALQVANLESRDVQHYTVLNLAGTTLLHKRYGQANNSSFSIDVSSLPEGLYFLQLRTAEGTHMLRFVKSAL